VVARTILMRLTEVTGRDWTIDRGDYLGQRY
jgi:hypothetical protein